MTTAVRFEARCPECGFRVTAVSEQGAAAGAWAHANWHSVPSSLKSFGDSFRLFYNRSAQREANAGDFK